MVSGVLVQLILLALSFAHGIKPVQSNLFGVVVTFTAERCRTAA